MLDHIKQFVQNIINKKYTFLTLSGKSEVGKTHLLGRCNVLLRKMNLSHLENSKSFFYPQVLFLKWYEITPMLLERSDEGKKLMDQIKNARIVIIEELLKFKVINAFTDIEIEKAFEIIDLRLKRPTLFDTNKSYEDIERIDKRIASRLRRNDGIILDIPKETIPYLDRK